MDSPNQPYGCGCCVKSSLRNPKSYTLFFQLGIISVVPKAGICITTVIATALCRRSSSWQLHPLVAKAVVCPHRPRSSQPTLLTRFGRAQTFLFHPRQQDITWFQGKRQINSSGMLQACYFIFFHSYKGISSHNKKLFYIPKLLTPCKNFNLWLIKIIAVGEEVSVLSLLYLIGKQTIEVFLI